MGEEKPIFQDHWFERLHLRKNVRRQILVKPHGYQIEMESRNFNEEMHGGRYSQKNRSSETSISML